MLLRHSNRDLPKAQRVKRSIRDIESISGDLEVVCEFLACYTDIIGNESAQEAIESLEDFRVDIIAGMRRLRAASQKTTEPGDILEKIYRSPNQKLCCSIMQAALDAMATADSMYQLEKDRCELLSGIWAIIFLLSANVAGKLCDLTVSPKQP